MEQYRKPEAEIAHLTLENSSLATTSMESMVVQNDEWDEE